MAAATKVNISGFSRITVQRTLEHLRRGSVVIGDDVASITMNTLVEEDKNLGARHFLFENIPQLKYKSPHVKFELHKQPNTEGLLTITYKDGGEKQINCSNKTSSSILEEVRKVCTNDRVEEVEHGGVKDSS